MCAGARESLLAGVTAQGISMIARACAVGIRQSMRAVFVVASITAPVVMVSLTPGLLWTATARVEVCLRWTSVPSAMEQGSLQANATALAALTIALVFVVDRHLMTSVVFVGGWAFRLTSATVLGIRWTAMVRAEVM